MTTISGKNKPNGNDITVRIELNKASANFWEGMYTREIPSPMSPPIQKDDYFAVAIHKKNNGQLSIFVLDYSLRGDAARENGYCVVAK